MEHFLLVECRVVEEQASVSNAKRRLQLK